MSFDNPAIQYALLTLITAGTSVAVLLFSLWSKRLSLMIANLDIVKATSAVIETKMVEAARESAVLHSKTDAQTQAIDKIATTATQTETLINSRHSQLVQDMAELRKDLIAAKLATEVALKQAAEERLSRAQLRAAVADERLTQQAPEPAEVVIVQSPEHPVPVNIEPQERGKP